MKKRIGSFLLALVLSFSLIPSLAVGASAATIDESYNTGLGKGGGGGTLNSSIFSSAVVQNTNASSSESGTAKSLEVVVKLKNFSSKNSVYALVMKASDYSAFVQTAGGPQSAGIDSTTYFQQSKFDSNYYAIGRKNPNAGTAGETISLPLVIASTENASALGADKPASNKTMPVAAVVNDNYFDEYVLVVFSTDVASNDNYYVDRFYVDADGYVRTPSYLIRYNANNPAGTGSVNGTPARTIIRALPGGTLAESTTLSAANPTRTGYTFLGWSKTAKTASADLTVSDTDYAAGASYPKPGMRYTVNDLHAVWKTIPVVFGKVGGSKNQTVANEVRVGVTFSQTFNLDGAVSDGTKNYQVTQVAVGGTPTSDSTKFPNNIPAGMKLERSGTKQWILSGTPAYDCDKPIVMTVEVTDQSNNTKDTMLLTIPKIEKGLQPTPDLDVNTGLGTRMVTEGEAPNTTEVGQIIGFYSAGQESKKDSANTGMTDGTGTYTNYYLTKGMVYEYRPKTAENTGDWREIPAPEALYSGLTQEQKTAFLTSLEAGATARYKTTITSKTAATCEALPDGEAWGDAYGAIGFANGLPVVTGLVKDAEYEIRFRENATYDASTPTQITVGGAAASSGTGGPSISFHLAGGELPLKDDSSGDQVEFIFTYEGLTAGQKVDIPSVEPLRAGYSFEGWTDGTTLYKYDKDANPAVSVAATDGPLTLAAKWMATTEGFCSVVFYDWDGTLLGSRIVPKGGSLLGDHETPNQRGDGADQAPLPPEYELLWDVDGDGEYDFVGNNNVGNDAANKMGYTFAGWVDNETGYSVPNVDAGAARGQKIPEEDLVSLTNITTNLVLKAAYDEDETIIGANAGARRYLISYTPFIAESGALQTSITVRRPQNARRSVEGDLYLQIALQPSDRGQTKIIIPLGTSDCETIKFSMPNGADEKYHATKALALTVLNADNATVSAELSVKAEEIVVH